MINGRDGKRCDNCFFSYGSYGTGEPGYTECRRFPATIRDTGTMNKNTGSSFVTNWPVVEGNEWCGEYKSKMPSA